ncbi:hypothetical protein PTKIN_Ptkin09bG0103500 [Pterospermum kingtungense]
MSVTRVKPTWPLVHFQNPSLPHAPPLDQLPFNKEPPRRSGVSNNKSFTEETNIFNFLLPNPGTILSLNSGSGFQYIESSTGDPVRPNPVAVNARAGVATPSSFGFSAIFPCLCKKKDQENIENFDDRRHKRTMKNRESTA